VIKVHNLILFNSEALIATIIVDSDMNNAASAG